MADSQYFLTYDFRLIYQSTAILKEFDDVSGVFKTLDIYLDLDTKAYALPEHGVEQVINCLYREPIGLELSPEKMNWIQRFETKMQEDSKILRNRSLVFNYMILKLLLAGMPESIAKNFVINYYIIQDVEVTPLEMIHKMDGFIKKKKYWILYDTKRDRSVLRNFIITMLKIKLKDSAGFTFEMFRADDKQLCTQLILPKLIHFNEKENYLVHHPIPLSEQKPYVMTVYEMFLRDIITTVCKEDVRYPFEQFFIDSIVKEMKNDASNYLNILELNPEYFAH